MSSSIPNFPFFQLRVPLIASDYGCLVKFNFEGLGIEPAVEWKDDGSQAQFGQF